MTFADLLPGDTVFLDANTLVYHFSLDPMYCAACTGLLGQIKGLQLEGCTSTAVIGEVAHRLMTLEAMSSQGWPIAGIAQKLRKNPAVVRNLKDFRKAIQEIPTFGIRILTISPTLLDKAAAISQATGLLTNDALIVAVMRENGLDKLARNDADFDSVPGVRRYSPV